VTRRNIDATSLMCFVKYMQFIWGYLWTVTSLSEASIIIYFCMGSYDDKYSLFQGLFFDDELVQFYKFV